MAAPTPPTYARLADTAAALAALQAALAGQLATGGQLALLYTPDGQLLAAGQAATLQVAPAPNA